MNQIASKTECDRQILCCYVNRTNLLQITRISNIPNWYFERTVFPGQRLLFTAPPEAELEIHTSQLVNATLFDKILCSNLQVHEGSREII